MHNGRAQRFAHKRSELAFATAQAFGLGRAARRKLEHNVWAGLTAHFLIGVTYGFE